MVSNSLSVLRTAEGLYRYDKAFLQFVITHHKWFYNNKDYYYYKWFYQCYNIITWFDGLQLVPVSAENGRRLMQIW